MSRLGNLASKTGWTVSELFTFFREDALEMLTEFQTCLDRLDANERKRRQAERERARW